MPDPADIAYVIDVTTVARQHLKEVSEYYAEHAPDYAAEVTARLDDSILSLSRLPYRYRQVGTDRDGNAVHSVVVRPYSIYYQVMVQPLAVTVFRVRHNSRKPEPF